MISIKAITGQTLGRFVDHFFGRSDAPVSPAVELAVPFAEKDEAKRLGAKWHPERKVWFVPAGQDATPFARWLPVSKKVCFVPAARMHESSWIR
jgi:Domain of unknown function (DUF5710)